MAVYLAVSMAKRVSPRALLRPLVVLFVGFEMEMATLLRRGLKRNWEGTIWAAWVVEKAKDGLHGWQERHNRGCVGVRKGTIGW